MLTPGGALCWALSCAGAPASSPASAIAATLKYSVLLVLILRFLFAIFSWRPCSTAVAEKQRRGGAAARAPLPTIQPQSMSVRNGIAVICGQGGISREAAGADQGCASRARERAFAPATRSREPHQRAIAGNAGTSRTGLRCCRNRQPEGPQREKKWRVPHEDHA